VIRESRGVGSGLESKKEWERRKARKRMSRLWYKRKEAENLARGMPPNAGGISRVRKIRPVERWQKNGALVEGRR